jgi:hypothetical protein
MKAGMGAINAAAATQGESPSSSATIVAKVTMERPSPNTPETICTGRRADSRCACCSWS